MFDILQTFGTESLTSDPEIIGTSGIYTDAERIMEFGARTCYASTAKMGTQRGFLKKIVSRSHLDVIEHGYFVAVVEVPNTDATLNLYRICNDHQFLHLIHLTGNQYALCANMRVWLGLANGPLSLNPWWSNIFTLAAEHAPNVFKEEEQDSVYPVLDMEPMVDGNVTLLSSCTPHPSLPHVDDRMFHFSFYVDNVSRSMTHQLVRHRLFSYSQESQRYVDNEKGDFHAIYPYAASDYAKMLIGDDFHESIKTYRKLRSDRLRKEDARYVLPNSSSTRLVVSGSLDAWRHFFWLRALDPAAQSEIRHMGQSILRLTEHTLGEQWANLLEGEMRELWRLRDK